MGRIDENTPRNSASSHGSERWRELRDAHRACKIRRHRSLLLSWLARCLQQPKRPHVAPLPTVVPGQVGISFAGHATVLLRYANRNVVCDPMLGSWVKGVKRAVMPGFTAADLHDVDVILITHAHADHLHRPTLAALPKSATVILPPRSAQYVSDLGFARVVELSADQSLQDHGVDISTASVQHGDSDTPALAYVIRGQGPSVFFCGDSGYSSGFAEVGARYAPDIAILPIGGYAPLSFRDRHMSPLDALYALEDLGARIMIPIHHGTFALSYERLDEPLRWLDELVEERGLGAFVVALEPGESRVFVPPRSKQAGDPLTPGSQDISSAPVASSLPTPTDDPRAVSSAADQGNEPASAKRMPPYALPEGRAAEHLQTTPWSSDPPWAAALEQGRIPFGAGEHAPAEGLPHQIWPGWIPQELEDAVTSPMPAPAMPGVGSLNASAGADVEAEADFDPVPGAAAGSPESEFLAALIDSQLTDEPSQELSEVMPMPPSDGVPAVLSDEPPEHLADTRDTPLDARLHVAAALF